ncbi:pyrrolysine--tRNA(Pyl) ligase small subunit [Zhenpiania hominis]|uniref:pyrrolysine--tRNA(Pyl) ligase small subunit n=1 Tax=Zhenpiania hominis TaxID=2763644 RepID=UPI0039F4CCEB
MSSKERKRYYRKKTELFLLLEKMKLWPSRTGILHGIREIRRQGEYAIITTHCGQTFLIRNSRNCRAARWLRNKWVFEPCKACKVPEWKLEKYAKTFFSSSYGSTLENQEKQK